MLIQLSNSELFAEVDEVDYLTLMMISRFHVLRNGYVRANCALQQYLHHMVAARMGLRDFETIDHDNRNKLDNRRCNIKAATYSQNLINTKLRATSTSGHRHVVWSAKTNKWQVEISRTDFRKHLGFFKTVEEAVVARNKFLKSSNTQVGDL